MKKGEVSKVANLTREGQLEFLFDLYSRGVKISSTDRALLIRHKYIKPTLADKPKKETFNTGVSTGSKSHLQQKADELINVVDGDSEIFEEGRRHIIMDSETYDKLSETNLFKYEGGKKIVKADWAPEDNIYHKPDFVNWVNSFNSGFQDMIRYKKFALYCQQSEDWLNDGVSMSSFDNTEQKKEYAISEIERCKENTLYFMDKYLQLKEGDMNGGMRKYTSKPVHKVICFLVDSGYSLYMGKPRQIAATSTLGGIAVAKSILNKNYFIKFVTQDKETGVEIFEDKIKYPFGELPPWMKPAVMNDRDNLFKLSRKTDRKGTAGGVNSKIQVVAPTVSAINGGSPSLVLVDEAGYIGILGKMVKEARPTMFMMNEQTGRLEMKRQIIVWGTGGAMDKGGKAFEVEFHNSLDKWNKGEFTSGMIPIFFDWTTRPGITKKFYEEEKKVYTVEGPEKEAKMVQFRQTYPTTVDDMFLTSHKLLVGIDWINTNKERIKNAEHKYRPTKGYFEPIYDTTKPSDENSDTPFKIIGAEFIALDDLKDDMSKCSVEILMFPKKTWKNRYHQGTDPIMSDNGYSNMASMVFDSRFNAPAAIMDYRNPDHKYTFLQCVLLGVFYGKEGAAIPELVEANIGTAYIDYKENKGFGKSLVQRMELPDHMQGGGNLHGIDNRGNRNKFIINKLFEVLSSYGDRCSFPVVYDQLRTFVCKITDKGNETWGVVDVKKYHDDVLFAYVFAYICSLTYSHREPFDSTNEGKSIKTRKKLVRGKDGKLKRVEYRVRM